MKKLLSALLALSLLGACATSRLGRSQLSLVSASDLTQMGIEAFSTMKQELPQETNAAINNYVRCVAGHITRELGGQWEVVVFRDDEPNAFALPGGKIGVHTGILKAAQNQHQLATVIAHEISHVLNNHGGERVSQEVLVQTGLEVAQGMINASSQAGQLGLAALGLGAQFGILMPYSRIQESEADLDGLDLMAKAGFDPRESVNLWLNMNRLGGGEVPAFLSTHPSHATRIQDLQARTVIAMPFYQQALAMGKRPACAR
jgi:predicted Zn-dependent protease